MIKVLEGENSFLSKQKLQSLIKEYLEEKPNPTHKIMDANDVSISEITNEYETQDMFSANKLLVIKRLLSNKEHKEFVEKVINTQDASQNIDLIIWEEKNIPKNTKYYKLFKEINAIESFNKFNKRTFQIWAREYLKTKEFEIDEQTLKTLVEITDYNPYIFINETEKFLLSDKKQLSLKDLEESVNSTYTNTIWELIDAINTKSNMEKHTEIMLNLLKNGADPHYLMIMLARNTKQLILIKQMLQEGKSDKEIISILKIPPFTLPKLKNIAQKSDEEKLLNIFEKIYNLNYESKIGNITADLGLILLITRLN